MLTGALLFGCGSDGGGGPDATDVEEDTGSVDSQQDPVEETHLDTVSDTPEEAGCSTDGECDDADPCTQDACLTDYGTCEHTPVDADGDGYPAARVGATECGGSDCDDTEGMIHPDAEPDCEGADLDCDTLQDRDEDADGYLVESCGGDDCNDADENVFPGSLDIGCTDEDRDCNGLADVDNDDDGYEREGCPGGDDCDDEDAVVNPGAEEIVCDGKDTNCNGAMSAEQEDVDQDGWASEVCVAEGREADCDDDDALSHPGADEMCDDVDNDCDGEILDAPGADDDADTVLDDGCAGGTDCDDDDALTHPGAEEICDDGVDQDCDTLVDGPAAASAEVEVNDTGRQSFSPVAAWTGSEFGVVFTVLSGAGDYDLYFARVSTGGSKVGSDVAVVDTPSYTLAPDLVWTGSVFGLVWGDDRSGTYQVRFKLLDATGADASTDSAVSASTDTAWTPSLDWTGSEFAVVWEDYRTMDSNIFFARVGADGTMSGSEVQVTADASAQVQPSLAWTGTGHGVAWSDSGYGNREIAFARLDGGGTMVGAVTRVTDASGSSTSPRLVWAASQFGMAWSDDRLGEYDILFARVSHLGTKVGSDVEVSVTAGVGGDASITWTGGRFVLVWEDDVEGEDRVFLGTVGPDGTLPLPVVRVSSTASRQMNPFVAVSASQILVSWQDYRLDPNGVWCSFITYCN